MSISKEQKVSELVERQLETLTLIEAMNIAGGFFTDLLESMDDEEVDELYTDMGAGRYGIH
jgi:ATP sulfurylase